MKTLRRMWKRLAATFAPRRSRADADLAAEFEAHIALLTEKNISRGMSAFEARRAALLKFGGLEPTKESYRDQRALPFLDSLVQDFRYGARTLRRSPGFTAVALLTLAFGIGANTAIFSVVNGILIEHLPYADASRLLTIRHEQAGFPVSFDEAREIQSECTAIDRMAIFRVYITRVLGGSAPMMRTNSFVSGDFFPMLGVQPLLGRPILPEDTQDGHEAVTVLSYRVWQDAFGGDLNIVGHEIEVEREVRDSNSKNSKMENVRYKIIGVMPKTFELAVTWLGETSEGLWMPLPESPSDPINLGRPGGEIVARIKPGATISQASSQLKYISTRFVKAHPKREHYDLFVQPPGLYSMDRALRYGLLILSGAVGFILLLACVNVSGLLVARAWARQQELTIRRALGASRLRVLRQLCSESVLLALAGGALALLFSIWAIRILRGIAPPQTPRLDRIRLDANVLWFTLAVSLAASILFGLLPAFQASSPRSGPSLKATIGSSTVGSGGPWNKWLRGALVAAEVALAVILVIGGALMTISFEKLMHVNTGVRTDHIITMQARLSKLTCLNDDWKVKCPLAIENILSGIESLPGTERVALTSAGPLNGGFSFSGAAVFVEGREGNRNLAFNFISLRNVTPGFFATAGIQVLTGRDFRTSDMERDHPVAIVSESFAREFIAGNPLGRRFSTQDDKKGNHIWTEIIGVVNDVRDHNLQMFQTGPAYYMPLQYAGNFTEIIARTSVDPMAMAAGIEQVVWSIDKDAPITNVKSMDQLVADSAAQPKFQAILLGVFSGLALLLAVIGIYGVISYSVVQRTHEIGVRVALGAGRGDIVRMIVGEGAALAFGGIAAGLAGAWGLTRFLRNLLYEVKPTDPATFAGVAILLFVVALAASYIPARRATRVDPVVALRSE